MMSGEGFDDREGATRPYDAEEGQGGDLSAFPVVFLEGLECPRVPADVSETGVERQTLLDLAVRLGAQIPTFTTDWVAQQAKLPMQMVEELLWELKQDQLIEVLGQVGPFNYKYTLTQRGSEYAAKVAQYSGYVGPAPVSLHDYTTYLLRQQRQLPRITEAKVRAALSELVLPEQAIRVAALAAASFRSLFLFGPPGNGKTSLGSMLHRSYEGGIWIPYCLSIDHHIVRIFDPQVHTLAAKPEGNYDQRWVYIQRPFIVVGGELTLADLDLSYSPSMKYYEAPAHAKANGGTFLVDDLGRQRMRPSDLLNRWIIPLERRVDYLTLHTGQRVQFPFHLMLIVATNLASGDITDEAFLRRIGYRLQLPNPDKHDYLTILERCAIRLGASLDEDIPRQVLDRYEREGRSLRASEPRDLLERARDYCQFDNRPFHIDQEVLDFVWTGYFGLTSSPTT